MNFRTGLAVSALAALTACKACPTVQQPAPEVVTKTRVVDTSCDGVKPIYLDKTDVLSDSTSAEILAHNKWGAAKCGWKPLK